MNESMHTKENTDIGIIEKNCESRGLKDKDNNCVLLTTGSLNPIHSSHIKNLRLVKKYLEQHPTKPLNVLAAYLSPSHDAYVRNKLGRDWIPAIDRCDLCKQVIKEETENQEKAIQEGKVIQEETAIQEEKVEDWIAVSAGECNWTGFADFDEVTMSLAKFLNEECRFIDHPLTVVYVCGLDHFNKCPYVARLAKCKNIACAVIYRPGAFDDGIKDFKEESSNIYYITLDDERETLIDISSTAIRNRYRNGNNTDTFDGTYSCVRSFLQKHYSNK